MFKFFLFVVYFGGAASGHVLRRPFRFVSPSFHMGDASARDDTGGEALL